MGTRIVFEFAGEPQGEEWSLVRRVLEGAKGQAISTPAGQPPHVVTAVLPDGADVEAALRRLRDVPGVGRAERDAARETFELE